MNENKSAVQQRNRSYRLWSSFIHSFQLFLHFYFKLLGNGNFKLAMQWVDSKFALVLSSSFIHMNSVLLAMGYKLAMQWVDSKFASVLFSRYLHSFKSTLQFYLAIGYCLHRCTLTLELVQLKHGETSNCYWDALGIFINWNIVCCKMWVVQMLRFI